MTSTRASFIVALRRRDLRCRIDRSVARDDEIRAAVPSHYELTIKGEPGTLLRTAFEDVGVSSGPGVTVLSADLDQAGLHGLLGRVEDLGLELLDVRLIAEDVRER